MSPVEAVKALGKGLSITLKYLFKKPVTLIYPREKQEISPNYRGFARLNGMVGERVAESLPEMPPCQDTCPAHIDVRKYNKLIVEGKFVEAWDTIRERAPFPASLGRICHHPCEDRCRRGYFDEAIAIRSLKRHIADKALPEVKKRKREKKKLTGEKVAVIGSGPAGLSAALDLVRLGYRVTVFEKQKLPGGMLLMGVPKYRLPKEILLDEVEEIEKDGVELRTGVEIGKDLTIDDLFKKEKFKAIIIAVGLQKGRSLPIPGADLPGVLVAVPFLRAVNLGEKVEMGKEVVVIGGGNVAVDAARCARRVGAEKVRMVSLEKRHEMPAFEWEIEEAVEEGVELVPGWGPKAIHSKDGRITGLEVMQCVRVFDEQGRFNPQFCETETKIIPGDTVIFAIGQASDNSFLEGSDVETDERGRIIYDRETMMTSRPGVFVCGEIATGPATCVGSIGSGHEAANSVHLYLSGKDMKKDRPRFELVNYPMYPKIPLDIFPEERRRPKMPFLEAEKRVKNFEQIELGFSDEDARNEALRCLQCLSRTCTACTLCARTCPSLAISIEKKEGEWGAASYDINLGLCIYCGFCQEICPTKAIQLTQDFERAFYEKDKLVWDKGYLLERGKD